MYLLYLVFLTFGYNLNYGNVRLESLPAYSDSMIVIKPAKNYIQSEVEMIVKESGDLILEKSYNGNYFTVRIRKNRDINKVIKEYSNYRCIEKADKIAIARASWIPDDPDITYQWHLDNEHLNMYDVWDIERGDSSIVIAIVDCGIAYEYNLIPEYEKYPEVKSSDGYYHRASDLIETKFVQGYDFVNNDNHPNDNNGHGTHVAGIIAQATDNGIGAAGMVPDCSIMPVKVLDYKGSGYATRVADGIEYALSNGADVINLSLGGTPGDSTGWSIVHEAIKHAEDSGIVVVGAAGNSGTGVLSYPAGFKQCISVAASEWDDSITYYSQYGEGIDLTAPGGDLYQDNNQDGYGDGILQQTMRVKNDTCWVDEFYGYFYQGTSMACPMVSSIVALLKSEGIDDSQIIKDILYSTAEDRGEPGYDTVYGSGILNPLAAISFSDEVPPDFDILVLQNSYMEKWIDIWVFSSEYLANRDSPPDSVLITTDGLTESISLKKIDKTNRIYHSPHHLTLTGSITIKVSGLDVGRNRGTNSRNYSIKEVISSDTEMRSSDDNFICHFNPFTNNKKTSFITGKLGKDSKKWLKIPNIEGETGSSYIVDNNNEYRGKIYISMKYRDEGLDINEEQLCIFQWRNSGWTELESVIDIDNNTIYAETNYPGVFQVGSSHNHTITVPEDNMLEISNSVLYNNIEITGILNSPGKLNISVFDISGRKVKNLINKYVNPGEIKLEWNGTNDGDEYLPSGTYIIHSSGVIDESKKLVLLKE